ncbi:enterochelin esterase [Prodigiosinella confusarubida]|uniref:Enterochelin esterase n=1 Tax=Serratia sp. (strain ATCC 39006) TaxID=104623 RepID=A0A2I5T6Q7_SERS3|nr:enterochelin esterase [Serratia sp. ATCC 39006]AUH00255.1 enterochelin esterase [Serratia sp. ATCC 39006]AUH04575.1 enterochelin esterase [Serratia sp. ATCC 39006]
MSETQSSGCAAELISSPTAGEENWWRGIASMGTPLVESLDGKRVRVTFFWRDPAGDERQSAIQQVYIDVNGVTDHHSFQPQSLQRLAGTDVWHWSLDIEDDWRGSYSLIPVTGKQLPPAFSGDRQQRCQQQREWWCSLFPHAIADPLNPLQPHLTHRGESLSAAHMPYAPPQQAWLALDQGQATAPDSRRLQIFQWESLQLRNQRRIWLYSTGNTALPTQRPLIIVLDGQNWAEEIPLYSALEIETVSGQLPPAVWLFIDVIDMDCRERELTCNANFWQAVQTELLPLAAQHTSFSDDPQRTVVAGQSYGGLAALYAGLHWPHRFGRVLTQSGSFWWPNLKFITQFNACDSHEPGWLVEQVRQGVGTQTPLTIFQEAGDREQDIDFVNQQMNQALVAAGHRVNYRVYAGGHDALCWRGGLIDGTRWLLADVAGYE